jgi:acetyl esterase
MTAQPAADRLSDRFPGLDRELAGLLDQARAAGQPPLSRLDPAAGRARVRAGDVLCSAGPADVAAADIRLSSGLAARLYQPAGAGRPADGGRPAYGGRPDDRAEGITVWCHGGGWVTGDLAYSDEICRLIAHDSGQPVLSVDYRLAPEHPFPAAIEDTLAAARWAAEQPGHPRLVLAGDSAGGNLAAVAARELRPELTGQLAGQLLVYPVLDTDLARPSYQAYGPVLLSAADMAWFLGHYCPNPAEQSSPRVAPLHGPDLSALPRTTIMLAGHDPLQDEGSEYATALAAAGVPVSTHRFESLAHGFLRFTGPVAAARAAATAVAAAAADLLNRTG